MNTAKNITGAVIMPNAATASSMLNNSSSLSSSAGGLSRATNALSSIANANNANERANATAQQEFQLQSQKLAQEYNSAEAAKNRNWQEHMSNTAHQREVADLKAAGLNPVLSAMNGNGASVTSGATASTTAQSGSKAGTDTSQSSGLVTLLSSLLASQTSQTNATLSALTQQSIADKNNEAAKLLQELKGSQALEQIDRSGKWSYSSAKYAADAATYREQLSEAHDTYMAQNYPTSYYGALTALLGGLTGSSPSSVVQSIGSTTKKAATTALDAVKSLFGTKSSAKKSSSAGRG